MKKILLIPLLFLFCSTQYPMDSWRKYVKPTSVTTGLMTSFYLPQRSLTKSKFPNFFIKNHTEDKNIEPMFEEIMQELLNNKTLNIKKTIQLVLNYDQTGTPLFYKDYPTIYVNIEQFKHISDIHQKEVFKHVIAHELGHIERHIINRFTVTSAYLFPIYMTMGLFGGTHFFEKGNIIKTIICIFTPISYLASLLPFLNRKREEKICDIRGMELCKTNIGALLIAQREKKQNWTDKDYPNHPTPDERISYMKNWKPKKK